MRTTLGALLRRHGADIGMSVMVLIWGLHYIVVKDAIATLPPFAFLAIRFLLGLPVMLAFSLRHLPALRIERQDVPRLLGLGLIGPLGYQVFFIQALARTTSTNTALLSSTLPTWIALLSLVLGIILIRRQLLVGVVMSMAGVVLVVLGGSPSGVSVSTQDLIGSGLALMAAMTSAVYTLRIKSLLDRYGGLAIALWTYVITITGLWIFAAPDLLRLTGDQLTVGILPHLLFSGILSCAGGFLVENYALRVLGPARLSPYYNITPIIAAAGGILFMGDPLTLVIVLGGALTLWGVIVVRRNTLLRMESPSRPAPDPIPHPAVTPECA